MLSHIDVQYISIIELYAWLYIYMCVGLLTTLLYTTRIQYSYFIYKSYSVYTFGNAPQLPTQDGKVQELVLLISSNLLVFVI